MTRPRNLKLLITTHTRFFRHWLVLVSIIFVAGCSQNHPFFDAVGLMKKSFFGPEEQPLNPQRVEQYPLRTISLRLGKTPTYVMGLQSENKDEEHWVGVDKSLIVTRYGIVTRTAGPEYNLFGTLFGANSPYLGKLHLLSHEIETHRFIDLNPETQVQLPVRVRLKPLGLENVMILNKQYSLHKVIEKGYVKSLDWSFENIYWVNEHGYVVKSFQYFHPEYPPIEMNVLKLPKLPFPNIPS
jgi:hypothetical protein